LVVVEAGCFPVLMWGDQGVGAPLGSLTPRPWFLMGQGLLGGV